MTLSTTPSYPTSLDSFPEPTASTTQNATGYEHDLLHILHGNIEERLEAKVGVDGSAVTTSHDYKLSGVTGSDKAVSKTGTETLTNKTLTTPVLASFYQDAAKTKLITTPDTASDTLTANTAIQTLTNKTLTSPVLTTPQINDTSSDHQYIFASSELAADRTVTLPLLTGNDDFVFEDHAQTLTNKTLTSPVVNTPTLVLPDTSPTADGSIGFDRTGEDLQIGDGAASQIVHTGAWTAFTPAWTNLTVGAGTNIGAYCQIGKTVHFRVKWVFGAGASISGNITLTLPVAKNAAEEGFIGAVAMLDSGTAQYHGFISATGTITGQLANGTYVSNSDTSSSIPFTWTTNDTIYINGTYEAA